MNPYFVSELADAAFHYPAVSEIVAGANGRLTPDQPSRLDCAARRVVGGGEFHRPFQVYVREEIRHSMPPDATCLASGLADPEADYLKAWVNSAFADVSPDNLNRRFTAFESGLRDLYALQIQPRGRHREYKPLDRSDLIPAVVRIDEAGLNGLFDQPPPFSEDPTIPDMRMAAGNAAPRNHLLIPGKHQELRLQAQCASLKY